MSAKGESLAAEMSGGGNGIEFCADGGGGTLEEMLFGGGFEAGVAVDVGGGSRAGAVDAVWAEEIDVDVSFTVGAFVNSAAFATFAVGDGSDARTVSFGAKFDSTTASVKKACAGEDR